MQKQVKQNEFAFCSGCQKAVTRGRTNLCSGCKCEYYCTKVCQQKHWRIHKVICSRHAGKVAKTVKRLHKAFDAVRDKYSNFTQIVFELMDLAASHSQVLGLCHDMKKHQHRIPSQAEFEDVIAKVFVSRKTLFRQTNALVEILCFDPNLMKKSMKSKRMKETVEPFTLQIVVSGLDQNKNHCTKLITYCF